MPIDLLRSLSHRNFRLFFLGQSISLIGTWMQQVGMQWLVYHDLGKSAWWLGAVAFAGQIPSFFIAPVAGVIADHTNRHRLVIATQFFAMVQAFILAYLTLTQRITVGEVLLLSGFIGIVNAFDMPARQSFLNEMIERREDLSNAIALNSSMFNGARLIGPALAGLVLAATSAGICFLLNALSFLAVLAALLAMQVKPRSNHQLSRNLREGLREGFAYAFGFAPIRALLLLVAWVSLLSMSYSTLLPVFATDELQGGAYTLGLLTSAAGIGALAGALLLASRKTVLGLGRWIMAMPAVLGGAMIGFSWVHALLPAMFFVLIAGFALMMQMASTNTVLQTIVDEDKRGRVMSLYTMSFMGLAPLGSLLAGYLADQMGAPLTVRFAGIGCIAGSVVFAFQFRSLRSLIRPIYRRMGILPEVATGIQEATRLTTPPEGK
jgi:MFS family permease